MRTGTVEVISQDGIVPKELTELRITASLKTHNPGIHAVSDIHGMPDYTMLLNIDGEQLELPGRLHKENSEPAKLVDPEAGDGIRYLFNKNLRLKAGSHTIRVTVQYDGVVVEKGMTLVDGSINSLVLEPIYCPVPGKKRLGVYGAPHFVKGVKGFSLILNGRTL